MSKLPRIGVSSCLLGDEVRFDGGHKRDPFITDVVARYFELVAVCPEMAIGLGVPRPTIQLRLKGDETRLVPGKDPDSMDLTDSMREFAAKVAEREEALCGYIVKKGSPSCGMERVPVVINDQGYRSRDGVGIYTGELRARRPLLPIEEEGRLHDPGLRENFFERACALQRWRELPDPERNVQGFIDFHARHKLMLMARGAHFYQELGRVVAGVRAADLIERRESYIHRFMEVMTIRANKARNVNVLQHVMGFFKEVLSPEDKQELLDLFEAYRAKRVPLGTPLTLLRHHLRHHPNDWLARQFFLEPYPIELSPYTIH